MQIFDYCLDRTFSFQKQFSFVDKGSQKTSKRLFSYKNQTQIDKNNRTNAKFFMTGFNFRKWILFETH